MDSIDDDDFGDLYASVELQAGSAINGLSDFTIVCTEPDDNTFCRGKKTSCSEGDRKRLDDESTRCVTQKAASHLPEASDSEDDDINIVLNEDDCKAFPATGCDKDDDALVGAVENRSGKNQNFGNQFIRPHVSAVSSNILGTGFVKMMSSYLVSARADSLGFELNQFKNSGVCRLSNACSKLSPSISQRGYNFWLPSYRPIFHVNIDSFEDKPWKNPGADITDFFNFGFDEKSWKKYCESLKRSYEFGYGHSNVTEADFEKKTQVEGSSRSTEGIQMPPRLCKGRAIKVESGIVGRMSSTDIRPSHDRDSDVVIQIIPDGSTEDFSGLTGEELGHTNSNLNETHKNEDPDLDHSGDFQSSVGSIGGKPPKVLMEKMSELQVENNLIKRLMLAAL